MSLAEEGADPQGGADGGERRQALAALHDPRFSGQFVSAEPNEEQWDGQFSHHRGDVLHQGLCHVADEHAEDHHHAVDIP